MYVLRRIIEPAIQFSVTTDGRAQNLELRSARGSVRRENNTPGRNNEWRGMTEGRDGGRCSGGACSGSNAAPLAHGYDGPGVALAVARPGRSPIPLSGMRTASAARVLVHVPPATLESSSRLPGSVIYL